MTNDTTRLLGLEGVEVVAVEFDEHGNPMFALVTAAEMVHSCPGCGQVSQHPHSWVRTHPRDLPIVGRSTTLTWSKRRWRCTESSCPRATFTESVRRAAAAVARIERVEPVRVEVVDHIADMVLAGERHLRDAGDVHVLGG